MENLEKKAQGFKYNLLALQQCLSPGATSTSEKTMMFPRFLKAANVRMEVWKPTDIVHYHLVFQSNSVPPEKVAFTCISLTSNVPTGLKRELREAAAHNKDGLTTPSERNAGPTLLSPLAPALLFHITLF